MGDERGTDSQRAVSTSEVALSLFIFVVAAFAAYWLWPNNLLIVIAANSLFYFLRAPLRVGEAASSATPVAPCSTCSTCSKPGASAATAATAARGLVPIASSQVRPSRCAAQ